MKDLQTRIVTDISVEPVTLTEVKSWLRITTSEQDTLLTLLITAARKAMEKYTASTYAQKTIHATWVEIPGDWILNLPYGPHISVDAVYLIDEEGTETLKTLNSDYYVYGDQDLIIALSKVWTTSQSLQYSARVEYKAGYGHANTETLPDELKLAILKQIATDYEMRENIAEGTFGVLSNSSRSLAAPYRKSLWF